MNDVFALVCAFLAGVGLGINLAVIVIDIQQTRQAKAQEPPK